MNFFEEQDRARRNTTRLIVLMALAVISLIGLTCVALTLVYYFSIDSSGAGLDIPSLILGVSIFVGSVVLCGSLYKQLQLSSGGKVVAEQLGGRMINLNPVDLAERRLLNVVEEMALASGTPVPPVYVMDDPAINAFAAGKTPQDAVIGVTRGAIEALNREELQGVIAHEFSHVFHGDMKLNIRLVSILHGILLLGLIGSFLMRVGSARSGRDDKGAFFAIIVIGLALMLIGYAGTFFGNMIKAAVSRQREYLADASAVQFTRNREGISGALKKIGGSQYGSLLSSAKAEQFSHMYFGQGISIALGGMLATHPPLEKRIHRLEPNWDGQYPVVHIEAQSSYQAAQNPHLAAFTEVPAANQAARAANWEAELSGLDLQLDFDSIEFSPQAAEQSINAIGDPQQAHLQQARCLLQQMPHKLRDAAHHPLGAQALVMGLLLDTEQSARQRQQQLLERQLSQEAQIELERLQDELIALPKELSLPLIDLSIPALKSLSNEQKMGFRRSLTTLILADHSVTLREWSLLRIVERNLSEPRPLQSRYRLNEVSDSLSRLLSAMAHTGTSDSAQQAQAFNAAKTVLGLTNLSFIDSQDASLKDVDKALRELNQLMPLEKPKLLKALAACISFDGKIESDEAELMRAIADSLDCPMPPLLH